MKTGKGLQSSKQNQKQPANGIALSAEELKRLTNFFSLLLQIDQKDKKKAENNGNI